METDVERIPMFGSDIGRPEDPSIQRAKIWRLVVVDACIDRERLEA